MRKYNRYLLSSFFMLGAFCVWAQNLNARPFANEVLKYEIVYHWGIIWKHAASAKLTLSNSGDNYNTRLYARTVSWADKIYKVRDTLSSTIRRNGLVPLRYVKSSHEGKYSATDIVAFSHADNVTTGKCSIIRPGTATRSATLQTSGPAYDMLSVFYMLRTLDFDNMKSAYVYRSTIFSGKKKELLNIKYVAKEQVKLRDKSKHSAYHIKFSFTQDGQTKSSDDIDTWISTDERHIPLMLVGRLPIGEVRCYYAAE